MTDLQLFLSQFNFIQDEWIVLALFGAIMFAHFTHYSKSTCTKWDFLNDPNHVSEDEHCTPIDEKFR